MSDSDKKGASKASENEAEEVLFVTSGVKKQVQDQ